MIESILKELTLDEKIGMIHGDGLFRTKAVPRLGIPAIQFSDGPMGVRHEFENDKWNVIGNSDDYVSYLPSNSALASTWNRELAYKNGQVLGEETRGRGKDVILAPGINIKRSPLCGRNFEYMSEDPYLTGELAVPVIQGIQESDVAACVKHFAANNQETERLWVEVEVSDRAMREIYLPAFEKAVKEGKSHSIMGAYNRYKGEHCCESKTLLNGVLRGEWEYDGMVVSDWGGVHLTKEAATSGLDVEMSVTDNFDEYCMANPLKEAVEKGEIEERLIDEKVRNILRMMMRLKMIVPEKMYNRTVGNSEDNFSNSKTECGNTEETASEKILHYSRKFGDTGMRKRGSYNTMEHHQAALEVARESVVLLKNEENRLPLNPDNTRKVLVIGDNANRIHSCGGGSAEIKALYEISPLMGIKKLLGGNADVTYVKGYFADDCDQADSDVNWQADSLENGGGSTEAARGVSEELRNVRETLRAEAVALAKDPSFDTVILVGGQNHQQDLEGHDRPDMKLPYGQDQLIADVLAARPDTVLVIASGSPVEMPWIKAAKTLVWQWYAGMEGGTALAEVLFGEVNPSGKLPETFPVHLEDCSAHCVGEFPGDKTVAYDEGIFVGYRYYDTHKIPVLFPFGHGLSYTEFQYSNLKVDILDSGEYEAPITENRMSEQVLAAEGKKQGNIRVKLDVTNIGNIRGKETVQIYVGKKDTAYSSVVGYADQLLTEKKDGKSAEKIVPRALKELKGFAKVDLKPGETKMVEFELDQNAFAYYDEEKGAFVVEPGTYTIFAGRSVADICLETEIEYGSC